LDFFYSVNIESPSLTLVLCLDYLLQIAGFFAAPPSPPSPSIKAQASAITAVGEAMAAGGNKINI
jgi:hypothetical protein